MPFANFQLPEFAKVQQWEVRAKRAKRLTDQAFDVYAVKKLAFDLTHPWMSNESSRNDTAGRLHILAVWKDCPCCQVLMSCPLWCGHGCLCVSVGGRWDLMDVSLWRAYRTAEVEVSPLSIPAAYLCLKTKQDLLPRLDSIISCTVLRSVKRRI